MSRIEILSVSIVMLVFSAATANAATITVYTDKTDWSNAVNGQFLTEKFADSTLNAGVSFTSTESGHINPAQEYYQDVLASHSQNDPMTTWSFTPQITAYGGNWTLGGPGGSGNSLLVYTADSDVYVGAISNSYGGGFWGFTSDTPLTAVKLVGGGGSRQQNYSLDDMVYSPFPDTNADGIIDDADYENLLAQFGGAPGDESADFNGDGHVGLEDFAILRGSFDLVGKSAQVTAPAAVVPEPSTLVLLIAGTAGLVIRKRRYGIPRS
ncbi:MAG: PEP-CTERM sorting domain-containing protein [Phycisphaerales bacterium]|jgi:hypothetical protein|nr:PEP-CTERM sorting domain-containing protein [Phycisphaerales bacterium]